MKITVVGGGFAGALTSAFLKKELPNSTVEMIHSNKVPTIGVGESITPHLPGVLGALGVDEKRFMRETNAVFKYANRMENWTDTAEGEPDVIRMFHWSNWHDKETTWKNVCSVGPDDLRTSDVWLDVYRSGAAPDLDVYHHNGEGYHYLKDRKMPFDDDGNYLISATATYAYHIDAEKCAPWLIENVCKKYGVVETIAHIETVNTDDNGISSIVLEDGTEVTSDLWMDCTGLGRLLIGKLTDEFIQTPANKMNSAWVCPISYKDKDAEYVNYTRSIRQDMGWQFQICLDARIGTGIIYSDEYFSDNEAKDWLLEQVEGRNLRPPKQLKWKPGRLAKPNVGNCFAIGMAASFVDPLEANAVVSIIASIKNIAWMLQRGYDKNYYNEKMDHYFQDIADFLAVHYTLSPKGDNAFWNDMRRLGEELNHKELVKQKYYDHANCMDGVIGYRTAFPDVNWIDIANNWMTKEDLASWPVKSTLEQQQEYIAQMRKEKSTHESQANKNKKSIDKFMQMYNNVKEHDKGLNKWPLDYFSKMFSREGWQSHVGKPKTESKI